MDFKITGFDDLTRKLDKHGESGRPAGDGRGAAGGCIGLDVAGMAWDCYIGQDAVDHEIISQDFLGEPVPGPGHG